jgi:hypothetical protein
MFLKILKISSFLNLRKLILPGMSGAMRGYLPSYLKS